MISIEVNGRKLEASPNEILLDVLTREGIQVPTLCHVKHLLPSGDCRLCSVEVDGMETLVLSCASTVFNGMKVQTHSPRVISARKAIIEFLLANHPDECLYCIRNADCELRSLAGAVDIRRRRFSKVEKEFSRSADDDVSGGAIMRDSSMCILCGRCVRVCEEVVKISAIDFLGRGTGARVGATLDSSLESSQCVSCGQCTVVCPTAALLERSHVKQVTQALQDPSRRVVAQYATVTSVSLGVQFDLKTGEDAQGKLVAVLRSMGFSGVIDSSFINDLSVMEDAVVFSERFKQKLVGGLASGNPYLLTCSHAARAFVEDAFPSLAAGLSPLKSPHVMMGALVKQHHANEKIFNVSIVPCTARKEEAVLSKDVDAVLTTRELVRMIRQRGIDFKAVRAESAESISGDQVTGGGRVFGSSGGALEALIRTTHFLMTGKDMTRLQLAEAPDLEGVHEITGSIGRVPIRGAYVKGLGCARQLLEEVEKGLRTYDVIEIGACKGGCVMGGGQPRFIDSERVSSGLLALNKQAKTKSGQLAYKNPVVRELYAEFLGSAGSAKSRELFYLPAPSEKT